MEELGLDLAEVKKIFVSDLSKTFVFIRIPADATAAWAELLGVPARRCYVSDGRLKENTERTGQSPTELVAAKTPDPGATMAGDFGEILTALFLASGLYPAEVLDPKKWRLKQDRTKPAPYSDVVQFILPDWPNASSADKLVCAEVKTKSTKGHSEPITAAIADSKKDREGRLLKTLIWLRERALFEDLGTVGIDHLQRFIRATDYPPYAREFRAVAVICSSLVDDEIDGVVPPPADECTLVVIAVPDLKQNYEKVYAAIEATVAEAAKP